MSAEVDKLDFFESLELTVKLTYTATYLDSEGQTILAQLLIDASNEIVKLRDELAKIKRERWN
jgi:hypothetical protein